MMYMMMFRSNEQSAAMHSQKFEDGIKMMRRLTFTGSTLRPQSNLQKAQIASELKEKVWPLLRKGNIEPEIDSEFSLKEATEAHRRMESSAHIGKIVLKVE